MKAKYKTEHAGTIRVNSDSFTPIFIHVKIDNLGKLSLEIGKSMTLRVGVEDAEELMVLIGSALSEMKSKEWPSLDNEADVQIDRESQIHRARQAAVSTPGGKEKVKGQKHTTENSRIDPFEHCSNDPIKW